MSKYKIELSTFITSDKGYWEYEDIDDLKDNINENELEEIIGYFPGNTNVTYDEIDSYGNNDNWIVCYQDGETDIHEIETFNSTIDLKFNLEKLIDKAYNNEYISVFNMKDMQKM